MAQQVQGQKGKGGHTPVEDPNSLRSNSTGRVIDLISEGPIVGIVGGKKGMYFDRTPLKNDDKSLNFGGVTTHVRKGDPDQKVIPGFDATETEVPFNSEVKKGQDVVNQINNVDASAVRVKIQVPQLVEYHNNGDIKGTAVDLSVYMKTNTGDYVLQQKVEIDGKTTSPYERAIRIELPEGGAPWSIKVVRHTDDSDDSKLINATFWAGYTLLTDAKLSYPDTAMVGLEIDAKSFGSRIPERTYRVKGLITDVPSNYDPETRTYTGLWDGTFKQSWHSNPAWVLYSLMTNPRFGLGDLIPPTSIDKWGLYTIGQYCDGPVPDGKGGFEPRFTFNGSIRTQQDAIKVLDNIASVFRGMIYWGAGSIMVAQDAPAAPAKLVSPANVIGGEFTYTGTPLTSRSSSVAVSWNNPDDLGKTSVLIIQDDELIRKFGDRRRDIAAIGCTSRGQAKRTAEWILYTEAYESEVVSYAASLDHANVRPGQIISIADPSYAGARFGGRIASASLDGQFTLDSEIVMEAGSTYTMSVTLPTGAIKNYNLVNSETATDIVSTDDAIPDADHLPQAGAMWVISATEAAPRKFRVLSNTEKEKNVYEISAVLHYDQKFDYVERDVEFDVPSASVLGELALTPPGAVSAVVQRRARQGSESQYVILANWARSTSANVRAYGVWIKEPDVAERYVGEARDTSIEIPSTHNTKGTYTVTVRAISYDDNESSPVYASASTDDQIVEVPVPENWIAEAGFTSITLRGDASILPDFKQFNIYGATASSTTLTYLGSTSTTFFVRTPPTDDVYTRYRVTQATYSGDESDPTPFISIVPLREEAFSDDIWERIDQQAATATGTLFGNIDYIMDQIAQVDLQGRIETVLEDARIDGDIEEQRTELSAEIGAVSANLTQNYVTAATQNAALAMLETNLTAQTDAAIATATQNLVSYADQTSAFSSFETDLLAEVNGNIATATSNLVSYADQNSAIAQLTQDLTTDYEGYVATATQHFVTQSDVNGSIAASLVDLETTVDGHTTNISTVMSSVDGIEGTYGVRVNNNNVISGFGLVSELVNGTATSTFTVQANKFIIASFDGSAAVSPFTVDNGVTYIKSAVIKDAAIDSAKIADLAVGSLKIAGEAVDTNKLANNAATAIRKATGGGGNKQIAITNTTGVTMNLMVLAFFRAQDTGATSNAGCRIYAATSSGGTNGLIASMTETGPDLTPSQSTVMLTGTVAGSANISNGSTKYIRAVGVGDNVTQVDLLVFQRQK